MVECGALLVRHSETINDMLDTGEASGLDHDIGAQLHPTLVVAGFKSLQGPQLGIHEVALVEEAFAHSSIWRTAKPENECQVVQFRELAQRCVLHASIGTRGVLANNCRQKCMVLKNVGCSPGSSF